jgi:cytochrome b561
MLRLSGRTRADYRVGSLRASDENAHIMTPPHETTHYDRVAVALHWLIGAALLAQIGFGFAIDELAPRGTPARAGIINLHKSCGIVLALLIVARLAWRLKHHPPGWPASMPRWQQRAALLGHRALYACMLVMPLSGYIGSNFSKHGVKFFGVPLRAWGPDLPAVYDFFNGVHVATAWVFAALIVAHVLIALQHAIARDGVFARVWP